MIPGTHVRSSWKSGISPEIVDGETAPAPPSVHVQSSQQLEIARKVRHEVDIMLICCE